MVEGQALSIGGVAKAAGVRTSRIRFYEDEGVLPKAGRGTNGYRRYPAAAVEAITFIERAQQLGFSLREITAALPNPYAGRPDVPEMLASLRGKLAEVERHLKATQSVRRRIQGFIREMEACAPDSPKCSRRKAKPV